jgi:hypothetical protein
MMRIGISSRRFRLGSAQQMFLLGGGILEFFWRESRNHRDTAPRFRDTQRFLPQQAPAAWGPVEGWARSRLRSNPTHGLRRTPGVRG